MSPNSIQRIIPAMCCSSRQPGSPGMQRQHRSLLLHHQWQCPRQSRLTRNPNRGYSERARQSSRSIHRGTSEKNCLRHDYRCCSLQSSITCGLCNSPASGLYQAKRTVPSTHAPAIHLYVQGKVTHIQNQRVPMKDKSSINRPLPENDFKRSYTIGVMDGEAFKQVESGYAPIPPASQPPALNIGTKGSTPTTSPPSTKPVK